eukprot:CCRYP_009820-RA/>CCRYP_009820-RA protein AED:0.39 eAED:0.39 QI:392/1/1/1/0/0/2/214/166
MSSLQGKTRISFLVFFISHIPITLLIDGQAFLPRHWYPQGLVDVVDWYAATFKDNLMTHPTEPWFKSLISIEILFQLPFFVYAVHCLLQHKVRKYFRSLCLVYGASTSTTLVPILASIVSNGDTTFSEKIVLLGFYLPYLIFPAWLTIISINDNIASVNEKGKKMG